MPRKPQQKRSKETVQAIVQAGFVALARHGREGATTRQIADIAGVSVGSLYEYFENKEQIYDAMLERFVREVMDMLGPKIPELVRMTVRDLVINLLYQFKDLMERNDGLYLQCAQYAVEGKFEQHLENIQKLLTELFTQYVIHNPESMRVRDLRTMIYVVINGGVFTIIRYLITPPPNLTFEQLSDGLANMIVGYVEEEKRQLEG